LSPPRHPRSTSETDESRAALTKFGPGDWLLTLEDDTQFDVGVTDVETDGCDGFHAEVRDEAAGELHELTTTKFGGPVRLRRRGIDEEN